MNGNKNVVKPNRKMTKEEKKKTQKVKAVYYDKKNILEVVKLLDNLKITGIEQCVTMTNIAQRLDSFIKEEEIEVEI